MLSPAAVSLLRRATRSALAADDGRPDHWTWQDAVPAADFLDAAAHHRLAPVLVPAIARHGYPTEVADTLRRLESHSRLQAMALVHATRAVDEQLAGIDHLFVKGVALGVQTAGDATARGAGDVDVVVRPEDLAAAVDALLEHGWRAREGYTVNRSSWAWRHQRRATNELALDGPLGSIDLHWRLDPTYGGLPSFDELWRRRVQVDLGPGSVATLALTDAFRHAMRHAAKDRWARLRSLVDIHRLSGDPAAWPTDLDALERVTLSVTTATIGLPRGAPAFRHSAAGIPMALRTQVYDEYDARFIADNAQRFVRYMWSSRRGPRELAIVASNLAFPPMLVADIEEEHTPVALVAAARRRLGHAHARLRGRL